MRLSVAPSLGLLVTLVAGCERSGAGAAGEPVGGTVITALTTDVTQLIPPMIQQVDEKTVADQIFEPLVQPGDEDRLDSGFRPAIADSWSWEQDSMVVVFHLNPGARWHDGAPVRANDVRFTFALYTDPAVGSQEKPALSRVDSVTARDSVTAVFWFNARYPQQFYDAGARMLILPEHLLGKEPRATLQTSAFARNPVGSGRFRLAKWTTSAIELIADTTNYHGRAKLDRLMFVKVTDANAVVAGLSNGELDAGEIASTQHYQALSARPELRAHMLPAWDYAYLQFNLADAKRRSRPNRLFSDIGLRRALTMAIDRESLVQAQFDSLGAVAVGPMTRAQTMADTTIAAVRYDSAGAARLLDSLGWKLPSGKQVRERAGQQLRFAMLTPSISGNRMAMAVRVQAALLRLGVQVDIDAVDGAAFTDRVKHRDFDVAFNATHAEPSIAGLKAYWSVAGANDPTGRNSGNYRNPMFDAQLDSAIGARDMATARAHARQAFSLIIADMPAIWVYEPKTAQFTHKRIRTAHVAPTAWWRGIADWSIPEAERIPRDRVGLRVASR